MHMLEKQKKERKKEKKDYVYPEWMEAQHKQKNIFLLAFLWTWPQTVPSANTLVCLSQYTGVFHSFTNLKTFVYTSVT